MRRFHFPKFTLWVAANVLLYAVAGCGSSSSTAHLSKYDEQPYYDLLTFKSSKERAHKAAVLALQERGFRVTLSDPQTGLLTAQLNSSQLIEEDVRAAEKESSSKGGGFWAGLLAILGIVFLVGLVSSASGCNETKSTSSSKPRENTYYTAPEQKAVVSYSYVVSMNATAVDSGSVRIQLSALRETITNGSVSDSRKMENKYLNYVLFESIQRHAEQ
ncbi:MAG: hypothetical protein HY966_07945 [Ignavibacteriales bacterium]|nr:hypothetical protein [Ignavibacteriales bacterium]